MSIVFWKKAVCRPVWCWRDRKQRPHRNRLSFLEHFISVKQSEHRRATIHTETSHNPGVSPESYLHTGALQGPVCTLIPVLSFVRVTLASCENLSVSQLFHAVCYVRAAVYITRGNGKMWEQGTTHQPRKQSPGVFCVVLSTLETFEASCLFCVMSRHNVL